jgi:uncharacterized phage-associated protein
MAVPTTVMPVRSTASAVNVAEYILHLAGCEPTDKPMTTLRLHHLLYYCQGWHLAWHGRPLFAERIEAREDGPFVYGIAEFKKNGSVGASFLPVGLLAESAKSVEQVWSHYRRFTATELQTMSRQEAPWKESAGREVTYEIPISTMSAYFGSEYRRLTGDEPGPVGSLEDDVDAGRVITLEELRKELGC